MSLNVTFTLDNFPVDYCWASPQQFATDFIALLHGMIAGTFNGINFGSVTPAPADQDKPWVRLFNDGTYDGMYTFYGGKWIRPHPIPANSQMVMPWKGLEADLFSYDGGDGTDPSSFPPTATTGSMWQRDTDFDFKFLVGMGTNSVTYDGNAATVLNAGDTGGEERHTLLIPEMPAHNHGMGASQWLATTSAGPDSPVGTVINALQAKQFIEQGEDKSHQNMPPYRAVIFARRTARKFITV